MAVQIAGILCILLLAFGLATAVKILYKSGAFDSNIFPIVVHEKFSIELFEGLCNVDTSFEQSVLHSLEISVQTCSRTACFRSLLSMTASTMHLLLLFLANAFPRRWRSGCNCETFLPLS